MSSWCLKATFYFLQTSFLEIIKVPFDRKIQPKHPTEPLKYWAKLLKPEEKIKSSAGCFSSSTECLKSSAMCLCYSITCCSNSQVVHQKYSITRIIYWLWRYLINVNKSDQSLLLKNNDNIQRLLYSEARGRNQLILANLIFRVFSFAFREIALEIFPLSKLILQGTKRLWEQDWAAFSVNCERL